MPAASEPPRNPVGARSCKTVVEQRRETFPLTPSKPTTTPAPQTPASSATTQELTHARRPIKPSPGDAVTVPPKKLHALSASESPAAALAALKHQRAHEYDSSSARRSMAATSSSARSARAAWASCSPRATP